MLYVCNSALPVLKANFEYSQILASGSFHGQLQLALLLKLTYAVSQLVDYIIPADRRLTSSRCILFDSSLQNVSPIVQLPFKVTNIFTMSFDMLLCRKIVILYHDDTDDPKQACAS